MKRIQPRKPQPRPKTAFFVLGLLGSIGRFGAQTRLGALR